MTMAMWLVPLALVILVVAIVALGSMFGGSESRTGGWSFAGDGLRFAGAMVLALGGLAAVWVGVGNHRLRSVLAGHAPFDWASASTIALASVLLGGGLLLADRTRRASRGPDVEDRRSAR